MSVLTLWKRKSLARRRKRIDLAWGKRPRAEGTYTCGCGWTYRFTLPVVVEESAPIIDSRNGSGGYVNVRDADGRRVFHRCPPL